MKLDLASLGSLTNENTALATINGNSVLIENAMENTLSRDGTTPNQMGSNFDMNSYQILNLPTPATANSPLRLQDLDNFIGGGVVTNIPPGGLTGNFLLKTSNADYQVGWSSTTSQPFIVSNTTDSTSPSSAASLKTAGGVAIAKSLWVGGSTTINNLLGIVYNQNAEISVLVNNANAGSSAASSFILGVNNDGGIARLTANSSTNTSRGGANSLNLVNDGGQMNFYTASSTLSLAINNGSGVSVPLNFGVTGTSTLTGNVVVGAGGTVTATITSININGSSGSASGALIQFSKNGTGTWLVGHSAPVLGGTQNDFIFYNAALGSALTLKTSDSSAVFGSTTSGTSTTIAAITGKSLGLTENLWMAGSAYIGNIPSGAAIGVLNVHTATNSNLVLINIGGVATFYCINDANSAFAPLAFNATAATMNAPFSITNTTTSTLPTNGALIVTGGAGIGGSLNIGGSALINGNSTVKGVLSWGDNVGSSDANMEIAGGRTADGYVYIDFHSSVGSDYDVRFIRAPGVNGASAFNHRGTNSLDFVAQDAGGSITFQTSNTSRMAVSSAGVVSILTGTTSVSTGTGALVVTGGVGISGALFVGGVINLAGAMTYGGVTLSNAVTGTGNMVLSASPTLTGTLTAANVTSSGTILNSGTGVGYSTGSGGTVTQTLSKSNTIALNKACGTITMSNQSMAAGAISSFAFGNSLITATDMVVVAHESAGTVGAYTVTAGAPSAGGCTVTVRNNTAGALAEAIVLRFAIIKTVNT